MFKTDAGQVAAIIRHDEKRQVYTAGNYRAVADWSQYK
jgi:hypothetical protein